MNRAQRRRNKSAKQMRDLERRVEATGKPGRIYGLTDACLDCNAEAEIYLFPGSRYVSHICHDDGCPAAAGAVPWQPVPL